MSMTIPSYYTEGYGIERLKKMSVCADCGTNAAFLSENAGDRVSADNREAARKYFEQYLWNIEDPTERQILSDYIHNIYYDDPDPELTMRLRARINASARRSAISQLFVVFVLGGVAIYYAGSYFSSKIVMAAGAVIITTGVVAVLVPFLKKLLSR